MSRERNTHCRLQQLTRLTVEEVEDFAEEELEEFPQRPPHNGKRAIKPEEED